VDTSGSVGIGLLQAAPILNLLDSLSKHNHNLFNLDLVHNLYKKSGSVHSLSFNSTKPNPEWAILIVSVKEH